MARAPVHLGLEVEGVGQLHKGFCHQQWTAEEEKRKKAVCAHRPAHTAQPAHLPPPTSRPPQARKLLEAQRLEFTCAICSRMQITAEYFCLPADDGAPPDAPERKVHVACWEGLGTRASTAA